MALNPANCGYLPAMIVKELLAGREVEVVGGVFARMKNIDDYNSRKDRFIGKFGEILGWQGNVAKIATRPIPPWAEAIIHAHVWGAREMFRWQIPEEYRK